MWNALHRILWKHKRPRRTIPRSFATCDHVFANQKHGVPSRYHAKHKLIYQSFDNGWITWHIYLFCWEHAPINSMLFLTIPYRELILLLLVSWILNQHHLTPIHQISIVSHELIWSILCCTVCITYSLSIIIPFCTSEFNFGWMPGLILSPNPSWNVDTDHSWTN